VVGEAGTAGSLIVWLQEKLRVPWPVGELSKIAEAAEASNDLMFVPALGGLGAPHWVPEARGTIYGLTAGIGLEQIVRASLEAIALSVRDLTEMLDDASGLSMGKEIKADGGMAANDFLMQFQADILGRSILVSAQLEGTSLGVAFLAGITEGLYESIDSVNAIWQPGRVFEPKMPEDEREERYHRWLEAVTHTVERYRPKPRQATDRDTDPKNG
jgi:glycerol kinase